MRIGRVTAYRIRIPFKATFSHALHSRGSTDTVVLIAGSDDGNIGCGEILPRPYLTGETIERVWRDEIPAMAARWLGRAFNDRSDLLAALGAGLRAARRNLATFAGWELALLDLAGKTFGFPVGDVLSCATGPDLPPGVVIDFSVRTKDLEKRCMLLRIAGIRHVKVKVGAEDDLRRVEIVHRTLADRSLRLDANAAWTADYAIEMLQRMRPFNVASVEQPVAALDVAGMRQVREQTGVAVVADESLCSVADARSLAVARAADVFNIRIGKCGGLLASLEIANFARENGLHCQLGTLVGETGILSRAAEIFGRRVRGFDFLEGKGQNRTLLTEDIVDASDDGAAPGMGLATLPDRITRWCASEPLDFSI